MTNKPEIMNQQEAAAYIREQGIPMYGSLLSAITNSGGGPPCEKKGNQKLFLVADVDDWIEDEKRRRADGTESSDEARPGA